MRVAILGLGQIGGSVGRALVAAGDPWRVVGWTRSEDARKAAAADGIEPATSIGDACAAADVVLLAVPPLACLELIDALAGPNRDDLAPGAVISDVASTKAAICARAAERGLRFVGGHPMAGRETSGYQAADPDMFRERPWIIVSAEPADERADAHVSSVAEACGAHPVHLTANVHDYAVAAISHVPLVVSASLVEAFATRSDWRIADPLAAGGWASMTRLARGDPTMGAGIITTNSHAIAARLRELRVVLDDWLELLDGDAHGPIDSAAVQTRLEGVRRLTGSVDLDSDATHE